MKPEIGAGKSNGRATSSFWEASVTWAANRKEAMELLYPCWTLQLYFMWSFATPEFYSFFQLDPAYWSRPVDRILDLWLWSDAVGYGSICIELPT